MPKPDPTLAALATLGARALAAKDGRGIFQATRAGTQALAAAGTAPPVAAACTQAMLNVVLPLRAVALPPATHQGPRA